MVYTSKEKEVASDKEAGRLVGMAGALNFDTFVPFAPVRFCCRPEATLLTLVGAPTGGRDADVKVGQSPSTVSAR